MHIFHQWTEWFQDSDLVIDEGAYKKGQWISYGVDTWIRQHRTCKTCHLRQDRKHKI